MQEGYSLSDIATATNGGFGGFGGNDAWVLIILFALIFGNGAFGGFGGNRAGGNPVTEADLCNANSFNELKGSVGRVNDQLTNAYVGLQNGLSNLGYETLSNFNSTQRQISDCCCTTQRAIDGVNYNIATNTAAINANTTAQAQKILDAICQNKIEALQGRVNQLELQNAVAGVVRYPNAVTYTAGYSPFCAPVQACGCPNI